MKRVRSDPSNHAQASYTLVLLDFALGLDGQCTSLSSKLGLSAEFCLGYHQTSLRKRLRVLDRLIEIKRRRKRTLRERERERKRERNCDGDGDNLAACSSERNRATTSPTCVQERNGKVSSALLVRTASKLPDFLKVFFG